MLVVTLVSLLSAIFFYVQALQHAMGAKRWGLLGLCVGPFAWPLFNTHRRLQWRRVAGQKPAYLQA